MAATKFKVGDVVRLRSGGPDMSVNKVSEVGESSVQCVWFSGKKHESGWFHPDVLEMSHSHEKVPG